MTFLVGLPPCRPDYKRELNTYHTDMMPAASDMEDEKPLYALGTVITDDVGSEGCSHCGT